MRARRRPRGGQRGFSMIELLIAILVISIGIFSVARMFPTASREQLRDRFTIGANDYLQEKVEYLRGLAWSDAGLVAGRHPAGTATEPCGGGRWQRFYVVTSMPSPLDNLKKIDVSVTWSGAGVTNRTVTTTTYVRR